MDCSWEPTQYSRLQCPFHIRLKPSLHSGWLTNRTKCLHEPSPCLISGCLELTTAKCYPCVSWTRNRFILTTSIRAKISRAALAARHAMLRHTTRIIKNKVTAVLLVLSPVNFGNHRKYDEASLQSMGVTQVQLQYI
ncbi:uncharacterized protein LOC143037616 isoform X1 [Oratosquilla oratoria]|uniref:uncharacterized protein LOC143037616 isoform X1 n=1 Tax=Oratosquilla oratoria TaxID=337810 RepID=UPI003F75BEB3